MTAPKQSEAASRMGNDLKTLQSASEDTNFSDTASLHLLYKQMQADETDPYPKEPVRIDLRNLDDKINAVVKIIQLSGFRAERIYPSAYVSATINCQSLRIYVENPVTQDKNRSAHRQLQLPLDFTRVDGVDYVVQSFGEFVYWFYLNFGKGKRHD